MPKRAPAMPVTNADLGCNSPRHGSHLPRRNRCLARSSCSCCSSPSAFRMPPRKRKRARRPAGTRTRRTRRSSSTCTCATRARTNCSSPRASGRGFPDYNAVALARYFAVMKALEPPYVQDDDVAYTWGTKGKRHQVQHLPRVVGGGREERHRRHRRLRGERRSPTSPCCRAAMRRRGRARPATPRT